jgi:hypothetical protein
VLHLLAACFAAVMLLRHGPAALRALRPGVPPAERRASLPGLLAAAAALALLAASLRLYALSRP